MKNPNMDMSSDAMLKTLNQITSEEAMSASLVLAGRAVQGIIDCSECGGAEVIPSGVTYGGLSEYVTCDCVIEAITSLNNSLEVLGLKDLLPKTS